MVFIVQRERPKAPNRRRLILCERDRVTVRPVQTLTSAVQVLIEILGLVRLVDEDVRLAHRGAGEIIGAEGCAVTLGAPVVRKLKTPITELECRGHEFLLRFGSRFYEGSFDLRIF